MNNWGTTAIYSDPSITETDYERIKTKEANQGWVRFKWMRHVLNYLDKGRSIVLKYRVLFNDPIIMRLIEWKNKRNKNKNTKR